jgi:hypothetical protein
MPSDFPSDLKELVLHGWSQDPKERPPVEEFKTACHTMLSKLGMEMPVLLEKEIELVNVDVDSGLNYLYFFPSFFLSFLLSFFLSFFLFI